MRDSSFRISLDIHEVQSQVSLPVKTGDTARKILINLTENGAPYPIDNNCIAIFSAIKSDGKKIINDCIIEANRIRYDITAQTVSAEGIVNAEIILYGEDEAVICSPRFDLVVDDRVVGVETISEDEKNFFDSFILSEQTRVANEQKRIEAYNNIDIDLKEDTDYFTVSVTKKDGTKEDVMIAKGKNSVSPAYISKKIDKDATDEFVPSAKAVLDFSGITNTKSNSFESIEAPLKNLKAYGTKKGNSKINLFKKNIFDIGTDVSGYFSSNTNGSKIITSVGTVSKNIDLSFSNDSILVNNYNVTGYYWLSKFVELTPNTDYTLSANNNMGGVRIYGADSNSENTVGTQIGNMYDNYNEVTFNSGEYKYYWISFFPKEAGQKLEKCQLEVGIKATEFESYQGKQTLTFTDTLYKVGDIKDEKDFSKGIKIKRVNAAAISSLGTLSVVTLANGGKGLVVTPSDKKSAISGAVCTNAEYERGSLSYLDGTFYENKLNFVFCGNASDTLETLTAKYGSAVLTYVIATEVETPIPEAELSAYRQLHTYEGVTTIVGDAEIEFFGCNPNGKFASDLQSQINDLDEQIEGANEQIENLGEAIADLEVTRTATGSAITIDSANAPLQNLKLYGKTTQDGTPTPDNPIELKSVGDSGSFNVGVFGNNLYSGGNLSFTKSTVITLDCPIVAGTYTLSCYLTTTDTRYGGAIVGFIEGGENGANVNVSIEKDKRVTKTFTLFAPVKHIRFNASASFSESEGYDATYTDIMLNIGSSALPYEEYKGQTLTNNDTLRGIGDIADEIDFARGAKIKRMNEVELDGSDDEYWVKSTYVLAGGNRFDLASSSFPQAKNTSCICDGFQATPIANEGTDTCWCNYTAPNTFEFRIITNRVSTVEELKAMLQANPIKVVYPLLTPIETPISEIELNAYRHLMTNKNNTTILNSDGADMEISYYINKPNAQAIGSLHEQINKDYLKLQQAIISTGGN
jgi:hypothetical protein